MRDKHFAKQVIGRVEAILTGRQEPDQVAGTAAVRAAVGLVLWHLDGLTALHPSEAWDYLDPPDRQVVHDLHVEYADRIFEWQARKHAPGREGSPL